MKVIPDTNVLISALLFGGKPREILNLAIHNKIEFCLSQSILNELYEVLTARKFAFDTEKASAIRREIEEISTIVQPDIKVKAARDPDDNKFLECAVYTGAAFLISGDVHLLELAKYQNIAIMNPADFLAANPQLTE